MVQYIRGGAPTVGRPDPAPQPRGRGVAARGDAALARRDHRGSRSSGRRLRLLQAGARARLRSGDVAVRSGRAGRSRSRSPKSCGGPSCSMGSAARRRCCASRPRRLPRPTPATTPRSSRSTRCCAGSSVWAARSRRWATTSPTKSRTHSTGPSRSCSRSRSGASPSRWSR